MRRRTDGEFLESAEVHGNFYATSRVWIEERVRAGTDVLLEIDWQGARQVKAQLPARRRHLHPAAVHRRAARHDCRSAGRTAAPVISRRLLAAGSEIAHAPEFDYVIINVDFPAALAQLAAIVTATRLRFASQAARHHDLFAQLGIG